MRTNSSIKRPTADDAHFAEPRLRAFIAREIRLTPGATTYDLLRSIQVHPNATFALEALGFEWGLADRAVVSRLESEVRATLPSAPPSELPANPLGRMVGPGRGGPIA